MPFHNIHFGEHCPISGTEFVLVDLSVTPLRILQKKTALCEALRHYWWLDLVLYICFYILCSCGYDQQVGKNGAVQAATDGLLGLGRGSVSLVSQLKQQGITKNVLAHCLSTNGGGFLYFGDDIVSTSRATWVPMARSTSGYALLSMMFVCYSWREQYFHLKFNTG